MNSEQIDTEVAASEDTLQRNVSMTLQEFEAWVSDNYDGLMKRAHIASKFADGEATPLLHQVIEYVLEKPGKRIPNSCKDLFGWFFVAMKVTRKANIRGQHLRWELFERIESDILTLGESEYFSDQRRAAEANRHIRKSSAGKSMTEVGELLVGSPGDNSIRWRYQQMRDGRLFDERAVRSLAESMHRASHRYRHMGEHGFSFTEFGQEVTR